MEMILGREIGRAARRPELGWSSGFFAALIVAFFLLSGCDGRAKTGGGFAVDPSIPVDPASHAGDVAFRIVEAVTAAGQELPITLYLGLQSQQDAPTRLGANAILDLREFQQALPELLTGPIDPSCGLGMDLQFSGAEALQHQIRASASADIHLYSCRDRGTAEERRGLRLFTQRIDLYATVSMGLTGNCIAFRLTDLDIDPLGLLGGLATLFGVTERARSAILEQARTTLAANPICKNLPPALQLLDPVFTTTELREITTGGIGVALAGSVDIAAENLVALLARVGADARGVAAVEARIDGQLFRFDGSFEVNGETIPYVAEFRLSTVTPTRIAVDATLDLRELQQRLPDLVAGKVPLDICGGRITLKSLATEATGSVIVAMGRLALERFDCIRTGPGSWQRGSLLEAEEVDLRADLSAELVDGCVVFRLFDLSGDPQGTIAELDTGSGRIEAARNLMLDAVRLYLEEAAVCPNLPPELLILEPEIGAGGPTELGEGGVGVALGWSVEVSPRTIIDLLRLLQARGALPEAP